MKKLTIVSVLAISLSLSACAVTSAGVKKGDERNLSRSINDVSVERVVQARLKRAEGFDFSEVDVEVAEGITVLAGHVGSAEDRIEAERIAWSAPHVDAVGNEIMIGDGKRGIGRTTKDSVLGSSIRTRLIADKSVKSRNINIETDNGIVYLLGVARTPDELARITEIASTTRGAREIVSYIKVHEGGAPVAAQDFAAAPSGQSLQGVIPQTEFPQTPIPQASLPLTDLPSAATAPQRAVPGFLTDTPQISSQAGLPQLGTPAPLSNVAPIDPLAPYYRDPRTGERIELDPDTKTIPFRPTAEGALSSALPSDSLPTGGLPLSAPDVPYYIDPDSGAQIPVRYVR